MVCAPRHPAPTPRLNVSYGWPLLRLSCVVRDRSSSLCRGRSGSVSAFSAYARHRSARRAVKAQRAVVGMSLEEIKKKKAQKPEVRSAQREAALREVKERNKKAKEAKKVAVAKSMAKEKVAKSKGSKAPSKGTQR